MTPPKRAKPKRCGAKRMPNLAAMRRRVRRLQKEVELKNDLYNQGYWVALVWVLSNVLTTPKPNKRKGANK